MLVATILIHKPPSHKGSGASLLPLQAIHLGSGPLPARPPLHSPSWYPACSPFCFLVIRALPNVAGSECQGQPVFPGSQWEQRFQSIPTSRETGPGSRRSRPTPLSGLPASTSLPLPLRSTQATEAPWPHRPDKHTSPPGPILANQSSGSAGHQVSAPRHCPRYNVMVDRGALDSDSHTTSSCVTSGRCHNLSEPVSHL